VKHNCTRHRSSFRQGKKLVNRQKSTGGGRKGKFTCVWHDRAARHRRVTVDVGGGLEVECGVIVDGDDLLDGVNGGPELRRSTAAEGAKGSDGGGAPATPVSS
jgi:hypothetical protein